MRPARFALLLAPALLLACEELPPPELPPQPPPPAKLRAPSFEPPPPPAVEPHTLEVKLAPVTAPAGGDAPNVAVSLRFSEPPGEFAEPGPLVLSLRGDPGAIEDVQARDAEGPLTLREKDAAWRSDRRPIGAVSVTYRVRLGADVEGARAVAGGFSGSGAALLMLPETADPYRVRIAWDLAEAGPGARAAGSLDADDLRVTMDRLRAAVWMAGPIGRMEIEDGAARFEGAWIGRAGLDPLELMPFAARVRSQAHAALGGGAALPSFAVFLEPARGADVRAEGRAGAVIVTAGEGASFSRSARFTLAAALVKPWIALRIAGPEAASRWITEGLAIHYARAALLRGGLATPDEVADDLRERVERYAESEARALGNEALAARMAEPAIQQAAADRGALYAADVDAAARARSGGKRSLDDVIRSLAARARDAGPLPAGAFREAIGAELGPEGAARFDAIITRGEPFSPPDDAFGPCFKAIKKRVHKASVTVWAHDPRAACGRAAPRDRR